MQGNLLKISISDVLDRLCSIYQVHNQTQLAEKLGVKQSTISGWKTRNLIDLQGIIEKLEYVDLNWLIYGIEVDEEKKEEKTSDNREKTSSNVVDLSGTVQVLARSIESQQELINKQHERLENREKEIERLTLLLEAELKKNAHQSITKKKVG